MLQMRGGVMTRGNTIGFSFVAAALLWSAPCMAQSACVGDCDGNGTVAINELITGVNIALGSATVDTCADFDTNDSGTVTIEELIAGVSNALDGCPVSGLQARRVSSAPNGIDDPLWGQIPPYAPTLGTMSSSLLYGNGQLNMSGTFDGISEFNGGEPANLELRAAHDGTALYVLAEWNDTTFNVDRRRWLFNGPTDPLKPGESADGWTSQLNDDKIAFAFEIEPTSSEFGTFTQVGCASSCHNVDGEGLDMRPAAGKVDIWHWKTSRSEPLGYVADQVSSPESGRVDDAGTGLEHRNRPSGGNDRSGPAFEWDGTAQTYDRWDGMNITLDPAYVLLDGHQIPFEGDAAAGQAIYATSCAGCHGSMGQGGIGPALTAREFARDPRADLVTAISAAGHPGASAFNGLTAEQQTDVLARLRGFSGVPGYFLTTPEGSVADITTQSNVDYTMIEDASRTHYRVLIIRARATGNADDTQFSPGSAYPFGVALMDNDGRNHIGSRLQMLSLEP
ncbi:MAG TPA: ethylbenzene dehydrogenase-related protein [Candidatus Dormibacteraeota bacterium]|nr:ethylbenzene dehydrogenase-related protein [Candidatus Dormibacteraeota bacterium]